MSRRRNQGSGGGAVRGPASALTSFLAGLGVEPSAPLTTWGNSSSIPGSSTAPNGDTNGENHLATDGPVRDEAAEGLDPAGAVTARTVEAGPSQPGEGAELAEEEAGERRRGKRGRIAKSYDSDALDSGGPITKKSRGVSVESDYLDTPSAGPSTPRGAKSKSTANGNGNGAASSKAKPGPLKAVGHFMECGECGKRFTVTAYTREHPVFGQTYMCHVCCTKMGIDPFAKPKKGATGKKKAGGKEDRAKIVHYEQKKGCLGLGDMCIQIIGKYIEDVEQLGDIGGVNMDKVCKIISKSRRLSPETANLFYSGDRTELTLYDCTLLGHEAFVTMAKLCPNLEKLELNLCGQLQADSVITWADTLKNLKSIELFAPFLVRKPGWIHLFKAVGSRLQSFLITQSPRIDLETVEVMVESCPNLQDLKLCETGMMSDEFLKPISRLKKLRYLDLSSPSNSLSDEAVIEMLKENGQSLETLDLSDNADLTDDVLPAIAKYCPNLRHLALRRLIELSDEGVAAFFNTMRENNHLGLTTIDLEKGHLLQDAGLRALVAHSGSTVQKLSILGWRELSKDAVAELAKCKVLEDLNLGWCRGVTDFGIKDILAGCPMLKTIRVWGCNQLTHALPRKKGVRIIGVETHTI